MVPDALTGGPRFAAFCERYVRHTKGRWARQPLVLEPWQREFVWAGLELQSPLLPRHLRIQTHLIECPRNGGLMRALSADAALQHGLNPSANIIDELHAHRDGALYTALTTGTLAREQPFTLWITTAGAREAFLGEMYSVMETGPGEPA